MPSLERQAHIFLTKLFRNVDRAQLHSGHCQVTYLASLVFAHVIAQSRRCDN